MLREIIEKNILQASAIIGFWPCQSDGEDDIEIYKDESRVDKIATFYGLRQQAEKVGRYIGFFLYFYIFIFRILIMTNLTTVFLILLPRSLAEYQIISVRLPVPSDLVSMKNAKNTQNHTTTIPSSC